MTRIDFAMALDSVDRGKLIHTLKYYKCYSFIIDTIDKLHTGDENCVFLNNEKNLSDSGHEWNASRL